MTRTIDYTEGFHNASLRACSFLQMRATQLTDPAVFPPDVQTPENMAEAILMIRKLTTERDVARKFFAYG